VGHDDIFGFKTVDGLSRQTVFSDEYEGRVFIMSLILHENN